MLPFPANHLDTTDFSLKSESGPADG